MEALCEKWRLTHILPADLDFREETWIVVGQSRVTIPTVVSAQATEYWRDFDVDSCPELNYEPCAWGHGYAERRAQFLRVEFDLHWPITDLSKFANTVFSIAEKQYALYLKRRGLPSRNGRRPRLSNYRTYLIAWDLDSAGKSVEEIARELYRNECSTTRIPLHVKQKVRDNISAAQELISGGYRELS